MVHGVERIAVHEAGHAIIARRLGLVCGGAMVDPDTGKGKAVIKSPFHAWQARDAQGKVNVTRAIHRARIVAEMAGREAEAVLLGDTSDGDTNDLIFIDRLAASRWSDIVDWTTTEPRMRRMARRLVRHHRASIERVAAALVERRALTGSEIDALMRAP